MFKRWSEEDVAQARTRVERKESFSLLDENGEECHWDWDEGKRSWRLLRCNSEGSGYSEADVLDSIEKAVSFWSYA